MTTKILLKNLLSTHWIRFNFQISFCLLTFFSFLFSTRFVRSTFDYRSHHHEIKNCNRNCIEPRNPIDSEGLRIRSLFCFLKSLHVGVAESHVKRRDGRFCYGGGERERGRRGEKRKKKRKREKEKKYRACLHHRHRARGVRVRGI